jgi:hypothetical protein
MKGMGSFQDSYVNLDRQHDTKKDIFKVETKWTFWCLLLFYCKKVHAACFDFYLGHHQADYIKHELFGFSCRNMDPYYAIFVVVVSSECTCRDYRVFFFFGFVSPLLMSID